MSLRINHNIEAMSAHRNLIKNDKMLSKSLERLSSGLKVNSAADGPATL
ncbi:MAG: flagellin, partial [Ignavibacteriaceae bacterium]